MVTSRWSIESANFTVVGHFNPAILNPDFILKECKINLGVPLKYTSPELTMISEIHYQSVRWFMDLGRMIVGNPSLERVEDFDTPPLAINYLNVLAYTPIRLAGINFLASVHTPSLGVMWKNVAEPDRLRSIIKRFDGNLVEVITKIGISNDEFLPIEGIVTYSVPGDAFIRIQISKSDPPDSARVHCNWEVRDLATNRCRLDSISQHYREDTNRMVEVVDAFCQEEP
jgi:hypothetical protein